MQIYHVIVETDFQEVMELANNRKDNRIEIFWVTFKGERKIFKALIYNMLLKSIVLRLTPELRWL